ncbi:transposase [Streptomyces sp. NRRL B-1347]|uniref:transposase n=1 Tax=Streptomyces sp. NRRL B-1347 TaxID=1476877 RepID=UPI001F2CE828|nr:transposase [Streptomyces sp. NRRL B-1347]
MTVLVLQFTEGLTDRQAADAVRARVDWKYALGLELEDPGFDASVLSEFRARLAADGQASRWLELMVARLREKDLVTVGGRQRTDATHVLAATRALNWLELVTETMRTALEALAAAAPEWLIAHVDEEWFERYARRADDYRLPDGDTARTAFAVTVGRDGIALLQALYGPGAPGWLREMHAVQVLRLVWVQQYYRDETGLCWRTGKERPPAHLVVCSPYDPDARYGIKRGQGWTGYKAHVTEVCGDGRPHLLVHVAAHCRPGHGQRHQRRPSRRSGPPGPAARRGTRRCHPRQRGPHPEGRRRPRRHPDRPTASPLGPTDPHPRCLRSRRFHH